MAEYAAHLTTFQGEGESESTPSIFEVLAQENLTKSLQPALHYTSQVLSQQNPSRYGWLYRYHEELSVILGVVLEQHYLRKFGSSFAENFYGMKRVPLKSGKAQTSGSEVLSVSQQLRSLICLVAVPYMRTKCQQKYDELTEEPVSQGENQSQLLKAFLAMYPIMHSVWESAILYYQLTFIFGKSKVHSPLLALAGVCLRTLTEDDILFQDAASEISPFPKRVPQKVLAVLQKALGMIAVCVSTGLSLSAFFLQFLEWWYASDHKVTSITSLPTPEPPKKIQVEGVPKMPNICPLCLQIRTNDTALQSSGFVFCYPCIHKYVSQHHCCPITGHPAQTDQFIKLYQSEG